MKLISNEQQWFEHEMKVKEVMTRMPFSVAAEAPVFQAKKVMNEMRVRHLPVLERGELMGVISDRDIRTAETFHGSGYLRVKDAMTELPYAVTPESPLCDVLTQMIDRKIGSALVTSPRGNVIGIFTTHDALLILRGLVLLGRRERDDAAYHRVAGNSESDRAAA